MKFIAIVLTAFLARVKPVSSIAKPSCMNITRKPPTSTQARLSDCSRPAAGAASWARAQRAIASAIASVASAGAILRIARGLIGFLDRRRCAAGTVTPDTCWPSI